MFRLLKFFGFFLLLVGTIFILVVYPNRDAFLVVFDNGDALAEGSDWAMKAKSIKGIAEFVQENPNYVSYLSTSKSDTLSLNVSESRTMGMLSSVLVIHTLFSQNAAGLDEFLNKEISLEDIDFYQLPKVYETSHENALARLEKEELIAENQTISTKEALKSMVVSNDIAIHDYFYAQLNQDTLKAVYEVAALTNTELIEPFLGIYTSINPAVQETDYEQLFEQISIQSEAQIRQERLNIFEQYTNDSAFRQRVRETTADVGKGLKFDEERNLSFSLPQTTAEDMHSYLSSLVNAEDGSVAQKVYGLVKEANQNIYRERVFETYAGIFDNRIGLQNGLDWGISKEGDERIQVVFFDELPIGFWFHLSSDLILQDIQQRMIWDAELRRLLPNSSTLSN